MVEVGEIVGAAEAILKEQSVFSPRYYAWQAFAAYQAVRGGSPDRLISLSGEELAASSEQLLSLDTNEIEVMLAEILTAMIKPSAVEHDEPLDALPSNWRMHWFNTIFEIMRADSGLRDDQGAWKALYALEEADLLPASPEALTFEHALLGDLLSRACGEKVG